MLLRQPLVFQMVPTVEGHTNWRLPVRIQADTEADEKPSGRGGGVLLKL